MVCNWSYSSIKYIIMKKYTFYILLIIFPFLVNAQSNLIVGSNAVLTVGGDVHVGSEKINNQGEFNILGSVTTVDLETSGTDSLSVRSNITHDGSLITTGIVTDNGNYKVERYLDVNKTWQLVSSPMDAEVSGTYYGHFLNWYDYKNGDFIHITPPTRPFGTAEGLIAKRDGKLAGSAPNPVIYDLSKPNTGDISIAVKNNGAGNTYFEFTSEFNLVGNPYPSDLDWDEVYNTNRSNISPTYYYYIDGGKSTNSPLKHGWEAYSKGDNTPDRYINNGQAFGVVCTTPGNITLNNSQRTHEVGSGFNKKEETKKYLEVITKTSEYIDIAKIKFNEEATSDFDYHLDAFKLNSFVGSPNVSFISSDNKKMYICEMPEARDIDLGFNMSKDDEVTFSLNNTDDFTEIILEDKVDSIFTDLKIKPYTFKHLENDKKIGRFTLHFVHGTIEYTSTKLKVYYYSNIIHLNHKILTNATVRIYSMFGQEVYKNQYSVLNDVEINANFSKGIYIVVVDSDSGKTTTKLRVN